MNSGKKIFKKSKVKIAISIIFSVTFLFIGTLFIIYFTSYYEMYNKNMEMLQKYSDLYEINGNPDEENNQYTDKKNNKQIDLYESKDFDKDIDIDIDGDHAFEVSTFYSVAFFQDGQTSIDNSIAYTYSNDQLVKLANAILQKNKEHGNYSNLVYKVSKNANYTLVVFMDNTIIDESINTLFANTLLFGFVSIGIISILSFVLAKKIIKPLEENAKIQIQFISDAGHELKTPISAVNLNLDMLKRQTGENKWIKNIEFENDRMTKIIHGLLKLAKTESVITQMQIIDFSRIILEEFLAFEILAFEKNIKLLYENIKENIYVYGNANELRQLISILLENAISYSNRNSAIQTDLYIKNNKVYFSVKNESEEIPKDKLEKIFNRFYRSDYSRTGGENHYGLGLSIAKAIISKHNGEIFVSSKDGLVIFTVSMYLKNGKSFYPKNNI